MHRGYSFFQRASRAFNDYPHLPKLLVLFTVSGGGLGAVCHTAFADAGQDADIMKKKRVVVLGTGWAGTSFLKNLKDPSYSVQVVSPRNYFAFTPLLPSVTCGTVEARSIVEPIRNIVKKKNFDADFKEAECYKIDTVNKKVHCKTIQPCHLGGGIEEFTVDYDYLVIAMGAQANTFNTPGVVENAHFLKEVEDAQRIRRTVIDCFERASLPSISEDERKRILHFVVVGGGPAGVEFAAELHDFVKEDLAKLYPALKQYVRITLLEAGDNILNMFDKRITAFAEEKFARDGIQLKTGSMVVKVSDREISTKERSTGQTVTIPYGMCVWATGIGSRPVILDFMKQIGQTKRRVLATDEWLRVEGCNEIYALGDCATINQRSVMEDIAIIFSKADKNSSGTLRMDDFKEVIQDICERYPQVDLYLKKKHLKNFNALLKNSEEDAEINIEKFKTLLAEVDSQMKNLPATAQVAAQQGSYLADCFNRMKVCEGNPEGPLRFRGTGRHRFHPFRYRHLGQFAPLGGEQTAAQLPGDWVSIGHSTQWLWYSVYASKLVSWRTRVLVVSDWIRRSTFGRDSSRI
ncbi:External alternative NAD(P)H-ubiquinone oxidoreductase B3, mitochondrial [Datura stramonium]|uniref:NADH:ubiquinone reductase (non-electrogenic) n=1 Tax=Datura stramonium TaxID=4076 RepID=A0ABS8TMZ3_DATST|nr:External alternative NAD(P)H-ubiquinone oxidoreductase B3, mitochondrial [Datura stramonium]